MSNYKHNCTKGPATYKKREVGIFCDVYSTDPGEGGFPSIARTEDEANAILIAEAFTVLHETGMTPRELADLLARLAALLTDIQNRDDDRPQQLTNGEYDNLCGIVTAYEQAEP